MKNTYKAISWLKKFLSSVDAMPPISTTVQRTLLGLLTALIFLQSFRFSGLVIRGREFVLTDFDVFYLAGRLTLDGRIQDAYTFSKFLPIQQSVSGGSSFMPWSYPPPFNLILGALAVLPIWAAYLVFTSLTLILFLKCLRRIDECSFGSVLILIYPMLVVNASCGQNGFLTGTLLALAAGSIARRNSGAVAIGLLIIKPQLPIAIAWYVLISRDWPTVLLATTVMAGICALATFILGLQVWSAFWVGMSEASYFLREGVYPLYRMVSVYALARSWGADYILSAWLQSISIITVFGFILIARRRFLRREAVGFSVCLTTLISPYAYDYDLTLIGVGIIILWPQIERWASIYEKLVLFALSWGAGFSGIVMLRVYDVIGADLRESVSIGGALVIATCVLLWRILGRSSRAASDLNESIGIPKSGSV